MEAMLRIREKRNHAGLIGYETSQPNQRSGFYKAKWSCFLFKLQTQVITTLMQRQTYVPLGLALGNNVLPAEILMAVSQMDLKSKKETTKRLPPCDCLSLHPSELGEA